MVASTSKSALEGQRRQDAPVGMLLAVARRRLKRRLLKDLGHHHLTPAQMGILMMLGEGDGAYPSSLARELLMDQPMVTRVVDRMVRAGLVSRERDRHDRRRVCIRLTAIGRRRSKAVAAIAHEVNEELLRGFSRDEEKRLRGLLYRLIENLEEEIE